MPLSTDLAALTAAYEEHLITYASEVLRVCMTNPSCTRDDLIKLNDSLEIAREQRDGRITLMFTKAGWTEREFFWYLDGMHLTQGPYSPPGGIR
jgi:hypothetical protein